MKKLSNENEKKRDDEKKNKKIKKLELKKKKVWYNKESIIENTINSSYFHL